MAAETLWAVVMKTRRGKEWVMRWTVADTRREAIRRYEDGDKGLYQRGRRNGYVRAVRVSVEILPEPRRTDGDE